MLGRKKRKRGNEHFYTGEDDAYAEAMAAQAAAQTAAVQNVHS